jgi:hypothetical protein
MILVNDFLFVAVLFEPRLPTWFFFIPHKDGMPRILCITAYNDDSITLFIGQLKKV